MRWRRGQLLGSGASGSVYLAMDLDTGRLMAVKQLDVRSRAGGAVAAMEDEIALLQRLRHPHVVEYLGSERVERVLSIFLSYVPGVRGHCAARQTRHPCHHPHSRTFPPGVAVLLAGIAFLDRGAVRRL